MSIIVYQPYIYFIKFVRCDKWDGVAWLTGDEFVITLSSYNNNNNN